jgi:hypothetical protein
MTMFIPTKVNIGELKLGSPDHKSSVSFGTNFMIGINSAAKKNQGFGQQSADASITICPVQIVFEDELLDMPTIKNGSVVL